MKITLTNKEAEDYFYNALCNAVGSGWIDGYGIELTYEDAYYEAAKKSLKEKSPNESQCYEDVLMEILRIGKPLTMVDHENGEDNKTIYLKDVHERVANTPIEHLMDMIKEEDDATTADVIIQTVFYKEVIFG
jgi:hypothetical protein